MVGRCIGRAFSTGIAAAGLAVTAKGAMPEARSAEALRAQQIARNEAIAPIADVAA